MLIERKKEKKMSYHTVSILLAKRKKNEMFLLKAVVFFQTFFVPGFPLFVSSQVTTATLSFVFGGASLFLF